MISRYWGEPTLAVLISLIAMGNSIAADRFSDVSRSSQVARVIWLPKIEAFNIKCGLNPFFSDTTVYVNNAKDIVIARECARTSATYTAAFYETAKLLLTNCRPGSRPVIRCILQRYPSFLKNYHSVDRAAPTKTVAGPYVKSRGPDEDRTRDSSDFPSSEILGWVGEPDRELTATMASHSRVRVGGFELFRNVGTYGDLIVGPRTLFVSTNAEYLKRGIACENFSIAPYPRVNSAHERNVIRSPIGCHSKQG